MSELRFKQFFTFVLVLFSCAHIVAQKKIITSGDEWFYYDQAAPPSEDWMQRNAPNLDWKKGPSPLGYGKNYTRTKISYGDNEEVRHITKYFQKRFRIDDPYEFFIYELDLKRDDGVVLYINGREFFRDNMPEEGPIGHETRAVNIVRSSGKKVGKEILLFADDLVAGINVISASVHQYRIDSIDCLFDLELTGVNDPQKIPLLLKERSIRNKDILLQLSEQSKGDLKHNFIILTIFLSLLVLVMFVAFWQQRHKAKKSTIMLQDLQERNRDKEREMMGVSVNSLNNQHFLKELKKDLEAGISEDPAYLKKEVKRLIKQIDYNLNQEEDWENLKKHFNAIHTGFFGQLLKLHPNLTEAELRHCIFIKLHMQTKEIAKTLNIDPRSVQVSRYRIKKKMNLNENTDLRDYLFNL